MHRHVTGAVPPCLWWLSGLRGSSGLQLSSAWGLCGASCCGSSEMSHVIPRHVFQTLKSHRWNCNVLGRCRKFGHPNYVRVLADEAPKANSCVRSSSHDTAHDPRDATNTTSHTPQCEEPVIGSRIGLKHVDRLITYPRTHNLSACVQPIRVGRAWHGIGVGFVPVGELLAWIVARGPHEWSVGPMSGAWAP